MARSIKPMSDVVERVRQMMELHSNPYDRDDECAARECDCIEAIVSLVTAANRGLIVEKMRKPDLPVRLYDGLAVARDLLEQK